MNQGADKDEPRAITTGEKLSQGLSQRMVTLVISLKKENEHFEDQATLASLKKLDAIHNRREEALRVIGEIGLKQTERYDPQGSNPRAYHQKHHSEEVREDAKRLFEDKKTQKALAEMLKERTDLDLVQRIELYLEAERAMHLSPPWHDADQEKNPQEKGYNGENEENSAIALIDQMQGFAFNPSKEASAEEIAFPEREKELNRTMIVATRANPSRYPAGSEAPWPEETYIYQYCEQGHPDVMTDLMRRLICDADLASFGKEWGDYWRNMAAYFRETNRDIAEQTREEQLKRWRRYLQLQERILTNHEYKTDAGKKNFQQQLENLAIIRQIREPELETSLQAALTADNFYKPALPGA